MTDLKKAFLSLRELGIYQLSQYALFQVQLRSGSFEMKSAPQCPEITDPIQAFRRAYLFKPDCPKSTSEQEKILAQASDILAGQFQAFGGALMPLQLIPISPLRFWTKYGDQVDGQDIKILWEPARFGWVFPLCQAYLIQNEEKYAECFWQNFERFVAGNPENQGPLWSSAQEVALRIIPWLLAVQAFESSTETTPERLHILLQSIWQHTYRISITLNYSRSQNNNHLLSEALGLMLGGLVFQDTPQGKNWLKLGNHEFQHGILSQIDTDGTYSQHSANYHRMMLHLALIYKNACELANFSFNPIIKNRLSAAANWLAVLLDQESGKAPNLGHNDGSNLLPIGCSDYSDYRPTIQAAYQSFFNKTVLKPGLWDDLGNWLGIPEPKSDSRAQIRENPAIQRLGNHTSWMTLRTVRFHSRPAHADLLTVDLWHKGKNLLCDAGTYAYNLPEPWQNSLTSTLVHNTVTVGFQDQMLHAGKFLWLKRVNAYALPTQTNRVGGIVYCDLKSAYTHIRWLNWLNEDHFAIQDRIDLAKLVSSPLSLTIHFLLPDWHWEMDDNSLQIKDKSISFSIEINAIDVSTQENVEGKASIIRAGETLFGEEKSPIRGWVSKTYFQKDPALSYSVTFPIQKSIEITTRLYL